MSKDLIIAEKPSVAVDITKALGGGFERVQHKYGYFFERDDLIVSSGIGHLVELECPKEFDPGYDLARMPALPPQFSLRAVEKTQSQLDLLKHLINRSDVSAIVNACDAGREGELIFRYIYLYCGSDKSTYRMWIQSMTPTSIMNAFAEMIPGEEKNNLFFAAQSRSEADWLIGVNGTRALSVLSELMTGHRGSTSVGRVQTPVVNFLVEREEAIDAFVAKDFFEIHATLSNGQKQYTAKWMDPYFKGSADTPHQKSDRFFDRIKAEQMLARCQGQQPSAVSDDATEITNKPPLLFDLTELQREANKKFGYTATQTLKLAQSLYETHKVLTYPRTDSTALPEDYIETVKRTLTKLSESSLQAAIHAIPAIAGVVSDKRIFNNEKISDHFAIIPNGLIPGSLTKEESAIYDLVLRRFIAAFFPPAIYHKTVRTTIIAGETFRATGKVLVQEGWLEVYGTTVDENEDKEPALCQLNAREILPISRITIVPGKTKKPDRYTEASLLSAMETAGQVIENDEERESIKKKGIGTPATRASIIEKILHENVQYAVRDKKHLVPTQKGKALIKFLRENDLVMLTSAKITGEWEAKLLQMEQGKLARRAFMEHIHRTTLEIVNKVKVRAASLPPVEKPKSRITAPCPRCKGVLTITGKRITCACGFNFWREPSYKLLSDDECQELLTTGVTPKLNGFKSAKGKVYSAALSLRPDMSGQVDIKF